MAYSRATIFGGSGFVGRYIVKRLAAQGTVVRVAVRHPTDCAYLMPMGRVGQIVPVYADVLKEETVANAVEGADAVINAVGFWVERGRATFDAVHVQGAGRVAAAAKAAGAGAFVHLSGLGAEADAESKYAAARGRGEAAVREAFPEATVLRPSIIFGHEDAFFRRFAAMARLTPALPLFGGGHTRLQPVYVGDVADAVIAALYDERARGQTYELGGPRAYTLRELMTYLLAVVGRRRLLLPVPFFLAEIQGALLSLLPNPPLTRDQVKLLKSDSVVREGAKTLADLGIRPHAMEAIVPTYLQRYRRGGGGKRHRIAQA